MRVLILTSSGGTAHDAAAYSIKSWLQEWDPKGKVSVVHLLEEASLIMSASVSLYNWIQKYWPWLHKLYWRIVEFEDLVKPGTVLFGRNFLIKLLRRFKPELIISTHPHINRGHFDLAKRVLGSSLRCITCCTELAGGFGFSRNWVSQKADVFWCITEEVAMEVEKRGFPKNRLKTLGPLFEPKFENLLNQKGNSSKKNEQLPLLVLGSGANGSNNHIPLLNTLLPLSGRIRVIALCGKRENTKSKLREWSELNPQLSLEALGFQQPEQMAELYKQAWAMVARPGARTATEAIASECVLIFNGFGTTMPQELLARRYFASRGIDIAIESPKNLLNLLTSWLEDSSKYLILKEAYKNHRLESNQPEIKKMILGLA